MAELASLGIEVQAKNVDQASSKLDKLSGAAKRAEAAVDGLGPASSKAGQMAARAADEAATALNAEAAAATKAAGALRLHAAAANQNVRGMTNTHNTANLAAQGFDIFTTAAGGMSAGLIGMQQGLQIAQVAMTSTGGFAKELGAAFLAMLSPVTLLAVGLTTLAAVGIQQVEWAQLAASALIGVADSMQAVAPYAVAASAALALLYAPSIIGGVVQLIALLGRLSVAALGLAASFAAANPAIAFVAGITAAVAAANIFRDELASIFGRDIVADAKNGVNGVIGAFVGGYEGIKATWSRLPAAIGDIVVSTANAVITGIENMINRVSGAINGYIQSINGMLGSLPFGVGEGMEIGSIGSVSLGRLNNSYAGAANEVESTIGSSMSDAMSRDYVGGFGEAISRGASAASAKLKELSKSLTEVDEKTKKKRGGGRTEAEKYSDIVDGANRRITSLEAERAALGMTEEAAAALKYETELLNQAQQKGITLTEAQKGELSALGSVMASIEFATKKAKEAIDFAKDTTRGFVDDFVSGLANGEGAWKSFANAAMNALSKIADKLLDSAFDGLFGGGGGGLGGLFGGLFGGGRGAFPAAPVGLYASGGYTGNGAAHQAAGIVHGGEFVFSKKATDRIGVRNLDTMHKRAKGYASGGHVAPIVTSAAPANQNGATPSASSGQSVVRLVLSPELVGQILAQAQGQSIEIVRENNKAQAELYTNGNPR